MYFCKWSLRVPIVTVLPALHFYVFCNIPLWVTMTFIVVNISLESCDGKPFRTFSDRSSLLWHVCHRLTTTGYSTCYFSDRLLVMALLATKIDQKHGLLCLGLFCCLVMNLT